MTQLELNELLYLASTAEPEPELEMVEELLRLGADPLGNFDKDDDYECAFTEVVEDAQTLKDAERLPVLIELFLRYGMDVESSPNDVLHPLEWVRNEYGLRAL